MRDNFNQRYISLMKGKVSNFSLGEINFLLENLDGFEINTLCIQKNDNYYCCKVDDMTVEVYHRKKRDEELEKWNTIHRKIKENKECKGDIK